MLFNQYCVYIYNALNKFFTTLIITLVFKIPQNLKIYFLLYKNTLIMYVYIYLDKCHGLLNDGL